MLQEVVGIQEWADHHVLALAERAGGACLHATKNGRYIGETVDWWTSGFWPGMLWLTYQRTGEQQLATLAHTIENELEQAIVDERFYELHHDVGFQFLPTAVLRYRLSGDKAGRRRGILAASLLMSRFNLASQAIEAWNGEGNQGKAIIDSMMNLPLLYWAAAETGLVRYRHIADAHARTAMRHFVRDDGTVHHIIRFDPHTGDRVEDIGGQGYAPDSAWSRGQAWALYGFALAARHTNNSEFLACAQRIADTFVAALPQEMVPPWDFRAPDAATAPRDSSAGAIAACGLLELSTLLPEAAGQTYKQAAIELLSGLYKHSSTKDTPNEDGLLLHATGNLPANRDVDVSLIYGDYFLLEALGKLNGNVTTAW
jgi:unsaturated chondroitin disaccharide hydrolase